MGVGFVLVTFTLTGAVLGRVTEIAIDKWYQLDFPASDLLFSAVGGLIGLVVGWFYITSNPLQ